MAEFSEFDFDEDLSYLDDDYVDQKDIDLRKAALTDPATDYFLQSQPLQPKRTIGMYVAENGFSVPLLDGQDDVRSAVDDGSLMIRSELAQDYAGFGGIFSSFVIAWAFNGEATGFQAKFNELVKEGLRSGVIDPELYMERFVPRYNSWDKEQRDLTEQAMSLGLRQVPIDLRVSASTWRYIPGTNVTMFRDPHVDGKYHFGVKPPEQGVGDYIFEKGEHAVPQTFRKHRQPFVAEPFIEAYEQIRSLPLFDVTQVPVMELQQDTSGGIHFLQYRRVDKTLQPTEPFDLPTSGFRTDNVRGVTSQDGETHRLLINPTDIRNIKGSSVFADQFYFSDYLTLRTQLVCKLAELVLCQDWVSFKDNHTPTAPLVLPRIAIGLYGAEEASWPVVQRLEDLPARYSSIPHDEVPRAYYDIQVTSNGREAVIESNWIVQEP